MVNEYEQQFEIKLRMFERKAWKIMSYADYKEKFIRRINKTNR